MQIRGSVAIVTGASSGIGRAVAIDLAGRGAKVVPVARRAEQLEATAEQCRRASSESMAVLGDVSVEDDRARIVDTVTERFGRVDILVNNAGISSHKSALETPAADIERLLGVNVVGALALAQRVLPGMVERHEGSVVNVGSVSGVFPTPKEALYCATKAALNMWTHTVSLELADTGIHAGIIHPGPIRTEIWEKDETPDSYTGRLYPPEGVARDIAKMIEKGTVSATSPRKFGFPGAVYTLPLLGRAMRAGAIRYESGRERKATDPL